MNLELTNTIKLIFLKRKEIEFALNWIAEISGHSYYKFFNGRVRTLSISVLLRLCQARDSEMCTTVREVNQHSNQSFLI